METRPAEPARKRHLKLWVTGSIVTVALVVGVLVSVLHNPHQTVDRARLESEIHTWAVKTSPVVAKIEVTCPDDIPIVPGNTFHCIVTSGGTSTRLTVTIENDQGTVTWNGGLMEPSG